MDKMAERMNACCSLLLKLVYVNVLWMAFTLAGLGLFGAGPATLALFGVLRQWIRGNESIPVFHTFKELYKQHFKEGNKLFFLYGTVGLILYIDLLYVESMVIRAIVIAASILYVVSLIYLPCILVHYEMKTLLNKMKYSVFLGIAYFQYTLVLLVVSMALFVILAINPGFFFLFGLGPVAYLSMWMVNQVFMKAEMQQTTNDRRLAVDK